MKKTLLAGVSATFALSLAATAAHAQSIDYGAMEQIFNEPVTTSATGSPQRATEVPVDMTIISAADIHRSGAIDIPTILSRVAGVDILPYAAGYSDVGVRGYDQARSPRLLVLINGRQVYFDHQGYTDWTSLPVELSEIRQIEVVRGPNSALFGFNAVSGVVNIITYNPKLDNVGAVTAYAGTHGAAGVSAVQTMHIGDRFFMRLSAGGRKQDQWKSTTPAVPASLIQDPQSTRANVDAIVQLAPKTELRLEGSYSNLAGTQVNSIYSFGHQRNQTHSVKATLSSDTGFGLLQAQVYQNHMDALTPGRRYVNRITVGSVQDLFKVGTNQTFRVGLEYRSNEMDTSPFAGGVVSYTVLAPSAMWNWAINDKVSLTAAARYDQLKLKRTGLLPPGYAFTNADWDRTISEPSVNLGAVYKVTPADSLRLTYARGVQAPTLFELGGLVFAPTGALGSGTINSGNPNISPSIVANYELAYDHDFAPLRARAGVKAFSQTTKDVKGSSYPTIIDVRPTPTTYGANLYQNVGDSKMVGFEASASGKFGKGFNWSADTTYTDVKNQPSVTDAALLLRRSTFAQFTPKYRSNLALGWTGGKWTTDGYLHHISKAMTLNGAALEPVAAYTTLASRVAYMAPMGIELAVSGQNLLHDRQAQAKGATGLMAERQVMFTVSKAW
uniref:TonB-dependent receptor plug n=1 Tax=Caulobacter sp. (strain K31) TaxID=366602 RepID=B0T292_CAUSK